MKKILVLFLGVCLSVSGVSARWDDGLWWGFLFSEPTIENQLMKQIEEPDQKIFTNVIDDDRMLLVLSAPSVHNEYYRERFLDIVDFQVSYANKIIDHDNVLILVDADTQTFYDGRVPDDILLRAGIEDIWMRDFTTVDPYKPLQFTYTDASMSLSDSKGVQNSFNDLAERNKLDFRTTDYWLDGGNIVDNYDGKIITTTRFLDDNEISYAKGKNWLRKKLGAKEVAILEPDDEILAHADGMVAWIADDVLLVNDYSADPEFREAVLGELEYAFPDTKIIEVPVAYDQKKSTEERGIESACGVNLNAVVTERNIYVPTFQMPHEQAVLEIIRSNTDKKVIPVNARKVCSMGGSVRCLTWQVTGENARNLIEAGRN